MAASLIGILFAGVPNQRAMYAAALDELQRARVLRLDSYAERERYLESRVYAAIGVDLRDVARGALAAEGREYAAALSADPLFDLQDDGGVPDNVFELYEKFRRAPAFRVLVPDPDSLRDAIRATVSPLDPAYGWGIVDLWCDAPLVRAALCTVRVYAAVDPRRAELGHGEGRVDIGGRRVELQETFRDWVIHEDSFFVGRDAGLPALRRLLPELSHLEIDEAIREVAVKSAATEDQVDIIGFSIPGDVITAFLPLLLGAMLAFLVAALGEVERRFPERRPDELASIPIFYATRLGASIGWLMLLALPVLAAGLVTIRFFNAGSAGTALGAFGLAIIVTSQIATWRVVRRLESRPAG